MPRPRTAPAVVLALTALATPLLTRRLRRTHRAPVAEAVIADPPSSTSLDDLTGAVRSVQAADIFLPTQVLHQIWSPAHLVRHLKPDERPETDEIVNKMLRVCYAPSPFLPRRSSR